MVSCLASVGFDVHSQSRLYYTIVCIHKVVTSVHCDFPMACIIMISHSFPSAEKKSMPDASTAFSQLITVNNPFSAVVRKGSKRKAQ